MTNLKSRCQIEITWFPFDKQLCTVILASTLYPNSAMRYVDTGDSSFTLNRFIENKVWKLLNYSYKIVDVMYPGYTEEYSELHLHFLIKRKPLFIITNLIIPALFLSVVILITFYIPYAQAMTICTSIILAYSVLALRFLVNKKKIFSGFVHFSCFLF